MKTIFFAGFKGGTGKSTLAVNFSRFLSFYCNEAVSFIDASGTDILDVLQYSDPSNTIEVFSQRHITGEYLNSLPDKDYFIVDCPSTYSPGYLLSLSLADYVILPFQYSLLDYFGLDTFIQACLKTGKRLHDLFLLPNQYSDRIYYCSNSGTLFTQNPKFQKIELLPPVPRSAKFSDLAFGPPDATLLNYVRPSFIQIYKRVTRHEPSKISQMNQ